MKERERLSERDDDAWARAHCTLHYAHKPEHDHQQGSQTSYATHTGVTASTSTRQHGTSIGGYTVRASPHLHSTSAHTTLPLLGKHDQLPTDQLLAPFATLTTLTPTLSSQVFPRALSLGHEQSALGHPQHQRPHQPLQCHTSTSTPHRNSTTTLAHRRWMREAKPRGLR